MNVSLVQLNFRVLRVEKSAELGIEWFKLVLLKLFGQVMQNLWRMDVFNDIFGIDGVVVDEIRRDLLDGSEIYLVNKQ